MEAIIDLLEKFWAGKATEAEKQQLSDYVNNQELTWKSYLQQIYEEVEYLPEAQLKEEKGAGILEKLHLQMEEEPVRRRRLSMYNWAKRIAAVLIIGVAVWGVYKYTGQGAADKNVMQSPATVKALLVHINKSRLEETMLLSDSSLVKLQPGSSISYYEQFDAQQRGIALEGTAYFRVAKDIHRPFRVTANGFTTTALGTAFTVSTAEKDKVSVKLSEGKVVITSAVNSKLNMQPVYLSPGQELVVNTTLKQYHIQHFSDAVKGQGAKKDDQHAILLTFNKTPLEEVFAQISACYKVRIDASAADLSGLSFTGIFEKGDTLNQVLSAICSMNDLSYHSSAGTIIITRL